MVISLFDNYKNYLISIILPKETSASLDIIKLKFEKYLLK